MQRILPNKVLASSRGYVFVIGRRYDIGVMTGCREDIDEHCAEEKTKLRGNATVLRCLVDNFDKTGGLAHKK
jgi:hypothetical protein